MAHPIPPWLPALLVLAGAAAFRPALACQCIAPPDHGFVHPDVTVLPANAQGVLFHAPADAGLTPDMFTATRLPDGARQRIRIMEVTLPAGHPMRPRLPEDVRLVRVGIEGGFIGGARYSIAWQEPGASPDEGRSGVEFAIDPAPLDLAAMRFATTLDGPARRTMLAMESTGGPCSESTAAIAQALRIQVPAALQRYAPALSLLSEGQEAVPGAAFEPLQYRPSLCTAPLFDRTAPGTGRDLLYRACGGGAARIHLRTWVGMLEVSDEFVPAAPATADLPATGPQSCTPFGMLRDAVERGDAGEAAHLSCELGGGHGPVMQTFDTDTERLPTRTQWLGLARQPDTKAAACARSAMQRMLLMAEKTPPDLLDAYLMLARETLQGSDPAAIAATLDQLHDMSRVWRPRSVDPAPGRSASAQWPLLPDLLHLVEQGGDNGVAAVYLIGELGPAARDAAPDLMRLAGQDGPGAAAAVHALQYLIPDDPALHRALPAWAQRPGLRAPAALAFQRVAGKEHPAEAATLLLPLVREGNVYAIDALADLGPAAGSATSTLLAGLDGAREDYVQARLLRALMQVAPDDAEVVAALSRKLLGPRIGGLSVDDHAGLQRFNTHATALVPVIDHLIGSVQWAHEKVATRKLIGAMALAPAQKAALLEKLERCKVQ